MSIQCPNSTASACGDPVNTQGCPASVGSGTCQSTCNCPVQCSAENFAGLGDDTTGLLDASKLNVYGINFASQDPSGEGWTHADFKNAHKYATRRLCVEAGFRLQFDMSQCDKYKDAKNKSLCEKNAGAPSFDSPVPMHCSFKEEQCSVATTAALDNGETCMYGVHAPDVLGVTRKCLSPAADGQGGVSPAQWIYSTEGPAFCDAVEQRGQSTLTDLGSKTPTISTDELEAMAKLSPWCEWKGTCATADGKAFQNTRNPKDPRNGMVTNNLECTTDADCSFCTTGEPCSDDQDCPANYFSHVENMGPHTCHLLNPDNKWKFVKKRIFHGRCSTHPDWTCEKDDDCGACPAVPDSYLSNPDEMSGCNLKLPGNKKGKTCEDDVATLKCSRDQVPTCSNVYQCEILGDTSPTKCRCVDPLQCNSSSNARVCPTNFCDALVVEGGDNPGTRNNAPCTSTGDTCRKDIACEDTPGFEWMGLCAPRTSNGAPSKRAYVKCSRDAECGSDTTCEVGCYLTDAALCGQEGSLVQASNHVATQICSTTGLEKDCIGLKADAACGPKLQGTCMPLCGTCQGPHKACNNDFPTCTNQSIRKRSTADMHFTKFPNSASPTGPKYTFPLPTTAIHSKDLCEGRWDDTSIQGFCVDGSTKWNEKTQTCELTCAVDGGPIASIAVPLRTNNVPLTSPSTDCAEVGGVFNEANMTCSTNPHPMVVHECVLGNIGFPDGTAARENLGDPVSAAALTEQQFAEAKEACANMGRGYGASFDVGKGCRIHMPTLKNSELFAEANAKKGNVSKLVNNNKTWCQNAGGTYYTHRLTYNEMRQTYNDGTRHQRECVQGGMGQRKYCELPTSRITNKGKRMTGFYTTPAFVYHGVGVDPALVGKKPSSVRLQQQQPDSSSQLQSMQGYAYSTWPGNVFPSDTASSTEGGVTWTREKDWMCHAPKAYCDRMEVDWTADPQAEKYPGCKITTFQGVMENIFGSTITRNFRKYVIEGYASANKACHGGVAGFFCGTGAAIGGWYQSAGEDIAAAGKGIVKGIKSLYCDRRLKTNIVPVEADRLGRDCHLYVYEWDKRAARHGIASRGKPAFGFMADEVRQRFGKDLVRPSEENGFLALNLDAVQTRIDQNDADAAVLKQLYWWSINGERVGALMKHVHDTYQQRFADVATTKRKHAEHMKDVVRHM